MISQAKEGNIALKEPRMRMDEDRSNLLIKIWIGPS